MPGVPDENDPLEGLKRQWVAEDDPVRASALLEARRALADVYDELKKKPVEAPDEAGPILQRPKAFAEVYNQQPQQMQPLLAAVRDQERRQRDQAAEAQRVADLKSQPLWMVPGHIAARRFGQELLLNRGPSFISDEREKELRQHYAEAVHQRLVEQNPDWTEERIQKEMAGGATALGGIKGFIGEKVLPNLLSMTAQVPEYLGSVAIAGPAGPFVVGAARGQSMDEKEAEAAQDARIAEASKAIGGESALDKAMRHGLGRMKRSVEAGVPMLAGGALGTLAEKVPGGALAKGLATSAASSLGFVAAADPERALKEPGAALADAALFAVMGHAAELPMKAAGIGLRKMTGRPPPAAAPAPAPEAEAADLSHAAEVRTAARQDAYDRTAKDSAAATEGFDGLPDAVAGPVKEALAAGKGSAGAAAAAESVFDARGPLSPMLEQEWPPGMPPPPGYGVDKEGYLFIEEAALDAKIAEANRIQKRSADRDLGTIASRPAPRSGLPEGSDEAHPGALETAAKDVLEAAADNEVADASVLRVQPVQPDPGRRWDPASTEALASLLEKHSRAQTVLEATASDEANPRRQRLQRENDRTKAELDRLFVQHEGRTLDQAMAEKPESPLWGESPGFSTLAGYLLDRGPWDEKALAVGLKDAQAKARQAADRIAGELGFASNQEVIDRLADHGEDVVIRASQAFAKQHPEAARTASWEADLTKYVTTQMTRAVNSFGKMWARQLGEVKQVQAASPDIDRFAQPLEPNVADPLGDIRPVINLASMKGGPLAELDGPARSEVASAFLHELGTAKAKAAGASQRTADVPGRSFYDIAKGRFLAKGGEAAWRSLTKAERNAYARAARFEIAPKVAELHEFLKQQNDLLKQGFRIKTDETGKITLSIEHAKLGPGAADIREDLPDAEGPRIHRFRSWMYNQVAHVWNPAGEERYFRSEASIPRERPPADLSIRRAWNAAFSRGDSPSEGTTPYVENSLDILRAGDLRMQREDRHSKELKRAWSTNYQAPDDLKFFVTNALANFKYTNKNERLPDHLAERKFYEEVAKLPPDQQEYARTAWRELRNGVYKRAREAYEAKFGSRRWVSGYVPETKNAVGETIPFWDMVKNKSRGAWDEFAEAWKADAPVAEAENAAVRRLGRPFTEHLLHRGETSNAPEGIDLDPFRSADRYQKSWWRFLRDKEYADFHTKALSGDYAPLKLGPTETVRDALRRFTGTEEPTEFDSIRIGTQHFRLAELPSGDGRTVRLKHLGGGVSLEMIQKEDGSFAARRMVYDEMLQKWQPFVSKDGKVAEYKPVDPEIRQGGLMHRRTELGYANPEIKRSTEARLQRVIGRQPLNWGQHVLNTLKAWASLTTLGKVDIGIGVGNALIGGYLRLKEFGPVLTAKALEVMLPGQRGKEARAALRSLNLNDEHVDQFLAAGPSGAAKMLAGYRWSADKLYWSLRLTDWMNRAIDGYAGWLRAKQEMKQPGFQFHPDRVKLWSERGIKPEQFAETYARQQAQQATVRTGAMIHLFTDPALLRSVAGQLFGQFARPTLAFANTAMGDIKSAMTNHNFAPLVRFVAVAALADLVDDLFHTNTAAKLGPTLSDALGSATPAAFDGPKGTPWRVVGSMHLPFPMPYGPGPIVTSALDLGRYAVALAQGNDDSVGDLYWEGRDLGERLLDQWAPLHETLNRWSNVLTPGRGMSDVTPSGDPEKPWAVRKPNGRIVYSTTDEELWRKALLGSSGSNQTRQSLAMWEKWKREETGDQAKRTIARRKYLEAVENYRTSGSKAALEQARELEATFNFRLSDVRREEQMQKLPTWVRALRGSNDQQADKILERYEASRSGKVFTSKKELIDAVDFAIKDFPTLSPDRQAAVRQMLKALGRG